MLLQADLNTHIRAEIITAIQGGDDLISSAISEAESQVKAYLTQFDTATLFAETGTDRDPLLLQYCKNIAVWNFITLANPNMELEFWKTKYDETIRSLERIQMGKMTPENWPPKLNEEGTTQSDWLITSQPRRTVNY
jgi:hypothetical protein